MDFKSQMLQKLGNFDDQLSFALSKLCGIGLRDVDETGIYIVHYDRYNLPCMHYMEPN